MPSLRAFLTRLSLLGLVAQALSCTPEIGDKCVLSTDCSVRGDRLCDTAQPGGYCTIFNCKGNGCPDKAACLLFNAALQGCGFDDRAGSFGSRTARSFCIAQCWSQEDCRPGYTCADPRQPPWSATNLDDPQETRVCLVRPVGWVDGVGFPVPEAGVDGGDAGLMTPAPSTTNAPVCKAAAPDPPAISATPASLDGGSGPPPLFPDAGKEAGADAGADAGDAGDAGDGG